MKLGTGLASGIGSVGRKTSCSVKPRGPVCIMAVLTGSVPFPLALLISLLLSLYDEYGMDGLVSSRLDMRLSLELPPTFH